MTFLPLDLLCKHCVDCKETSSSNINTCVFCSPKSSTSLAKTRNSSLLEWVTAEFNSILWLNLICAKSLVILAWLICFGVIWPNNVHICRLHVTSQSYHTLCEAS